MWGGGGAGLSSKVGLILYVQDFIHSLLRSETAMSN